MRALALPALGAVLTGLLVTGCGVLGGDGDADPQAGGGAAAEAGGEQSMEEAVLDFTACMRDNGVDLPDPEGGDMPALPVDEDGEMTAAMEECEALLPVDENAPSEEEVFEQAMRMTECMRENGLDVPDPEPGQGLAVIEPDDDEGMEITMRCAEEAGALTTSEETPRDGDGS